MKPTKTNSTSTSTTSEVINFTYDITSYGVDFVVDGLVQRPQRGNIVVPEIPAGLRLEEAQDDSEFDPKIVA